MICSACALWLSLAVSPAETIVIRPDQTVEYVARVVSMRSEHRDRYVECLAQKELPGWRQLRRSGALAEASVFEASDEPARRFLVLFGAPAGGSSSLHAVPSVCETIPGVRLERVELLAITPNSSHPAKPDAKFAGSRTEFELPHIIEYIAVQQQTAALNEYRATMAKYIGPAIGDVMPEGFLHNFLALETVTVLFSAADIPHWNQIHLQAYYPAGVAGAGVAGDAELDAALRRRHPERHGLDEIFGRLTAIRTKPRQDEARLLRELSVRQPDPLPR